MVTCPHCGRRLISHASAKCNWCGELIQDAAYQSQAEANRASYYAEEAVHDAQSLSFYQNAMTPFPTIIDPLVGIPTALIRNQERIAAMQAARTAAIARAQRLQAQAVPGSGTPTSTPAVPVPPSFGIGVPPSAVWSADKNTTQGNTAGPDPSRFDHLEL
jgi:hypothetical protein